MPHIECTCPFKLHRLDDAPILGPFTHNYAHITHKFTLTKVNHIINIIVYDSVPQCCPVYRRILKI